MTPNLSHVTLRSLFHGVIIINQSLSRGFIIMQFGSQAISFSLGPTMDFDESDFSSQTVTAI